MLFRPFPFAIALHVVVSPTTPNAVLMMGGGPLPLDKARNKKKKRRPPRYYIAVVIVRSL